MHIRHVEQTFKSAALKRKSKRVSHWTFGSITADQILAFDNLRVAGAAANVCRNARLVLRKTFEFSLPKNLAVVSLHIFVEKSFVFALLQYKHIGIWLKLSPMFDQSTFPT